MESQIAELLRKFVQDPSFQRCMERIQYRAGEVILFEHQTDRDLYLIENGKICIKKNDQSDIYLGSGRLIGELSFLQGVRRTATILASEATTCIQIQEKPFRAWLEKNPKEATLFFEQMSVTIADRLRSNIQREETSLLFGKESPILRQTEQEILQLANRLKDYLLMAEAQKNAIESHMREELKQLQARQEQSHGKEDVEDESEIFWVTENTEETMFSKSLAQLSVIYHRFYKQSCDIFNQLKKRLNRFRSEEMRIDIAKRAHDQFAPLLQRTTIYKELQLAGGTESPNLMSEILLIANIESNEMALNEAICAQETVQAYREQLKWYKKIINRHSFQEITDVTLINDITGSLFSLLYPKCSSFPINIHFYVDNPYSFGCVDVNFQQYGRAKFIRRRIQDWLLDIIEGSHLPEEQDIVFIPSVLDYLIAPRATRLLQSIHQKLKHEGMIFFSVLSETADTALFCDFLGWNTIRRTKDQIDLLLKSVGYTNILIEQSKGALFVSAKKN